MKKLYITLLTFVLVLSGAVKAQDVMVIEKNDNTTVKYNVDVIKRVYFEKESKLSVNITTLDAENIGNNTAKVSATFVVKNASKTFKLGFFIGTNSNLTSSNAKNNYNAEITEKELNKTYYAELNELSDGTKYYYRPYVLYDGSYSYGSTKSFTTKTKSVTTTGTINGHDWVDLGLPSGTRWATCNVGASRPEAYGDSYYWGETTVAGSSYKYYNKSTRVYTNIGNDISGTTYDVAHVKWGGGWRMPTKMQLEEVKSYCTITFKSLNGINGVQIKGPNGNTIFLPAPYEATISDGTSYGHQEKNIVGTYYSSTLFASSDAHAFGWYFFVRQSVINDFDLVGNPRYDPNKGAKIRPILLKQ